VSNLFFFILLLSILVIAHEWGHYWVARRAGVRVLRFAVGFGPELIGVTRGPTRWSLCAIPFGGFVKFAGDNPEEETPGAPDEFLSKPVLQRAAIVLAGPAMNYLLAIVVYAGVLFFVGEETIDTTRIGEVANDTVAATMGLRADDVVKTIDGAPIQDWGDLSEALGKIGAGSSFTIDVERDGQPVHLEGRAPEKEGFDRAPLGIGPFTDPVIGFLKHGGPAWNAGLRTGDRVLEIGGVTVDRWSAMRDVIREHPGKELAIRWERDGTVREGKIVPDVVPIGEGAQADTVGQIAIQQFMEKKKVGLGAAITGGASRVWWITEQVVQFLPSIPSQLWKAIVKGEPVESLGGPVRMAQLSGEAARWGVDSFFNFLALISTQLAIFNLLPIPVLDGGHLALYLVEAAIRRPPSLKVRLVLHQIGFALLLLLLLSVTVMDVGRLFG
jgi:regulator of sigma E protease